MRIIASIATFIFLSVALPARSTDLSDLWWNAGESGWGVNIAHMGDAMFLTFFVYSANNQPYWLSAAATYQGTDSSGVLLYTGDLYQTTGPWSGTPAFMTNQVVYTNAGTVALRVTGINAATLTYTAFGTTVVKQITRLTVRNNPAVTGNYFGGLIGDASGCPVSSSNGHFESQTLVSITGTVSNVTINFQGSGGTCTMAGPYTQDGRMGRIQGTIGCSNGAGGTASVFEIEANNSGVTARYQGAYSNGCVENGHFGGVRR
jgi:hypothetical protein